MSTPADGWIAAPTRRRGAWTGKRRVFQVTSSTGKAPLGGFGAAACHDATKSGWERVEGDDIENEQAVAYLRAVGSHRAAWRVITSAEQKERSKGNEDQAKYAEGYCSKVEGELHKTCVAVSGLLDGNPIGKPTTGESKGFYHKMQAGFFCHIAEFCDGVVKSKAAESARFAYEVVQKVAEKDLPATHPFRLGLALVYSAYQYEVLPIPDEACMMARTAFDGAVAELDNVAENSYMDSTLILHLLRDNLMFWTSDQEGGGEL